MVDSTEHTFIGAEGDDTWTAALDIAQNCLKVPGALNSLVRNSWSGTWESREFMRALGFIRLNPRCLLRAAELPADGPDCHSVNVAQAVNMLGVRTSAVVVAVNYVCQTVLKSNPPDRLWTAIFHEMMNTIEIGYRFGGRADGIGFEGGMLMGFARTAGLAILLAHQPREFAEWFAKTRGTDSSHLAIETFGCESYQVGALALQQLGFGHEIAIASALAVGHLSHDMIEISQPVMNWKAAYLWIEALRRGQSYPRDVASRECFDGISPPRAGQPIAPALGLLYSQVASVRRGQSEWLWHLPLASYDDTIKAMAARKVKHQQYGTSKKGTTVVESRT